MIRYAPCCPLKDGALPCRYFDTLLRDMLRSLCHGQRTSRLFAEEKLSLPHSATGRGGLLFPPPMMLFFQMRAHPFNRHARGAE